MSDDIGLATYEAIAADADVQAITTRGRMGVLEQDITLPAFVVDVVTNNAHEHLGGSSLAVARVRVDAYGTTLTQGNTLAETIRQKVMKSNHKGSLGGSNALNVREITIAAGPYTERSRPVDASDGWRQFKRTDYLVTYQQTGPS